MAQKKLVPADPTEMPQRIDSVPTVFVDQPTSFQAGPYVTKLTLGVEEDDGTDFPRPTITIAMPTVNLMRMISDLQEIFADPKFKLHNLATINEDLKSHYGVSDLAPPTPKLAKTRKQKAQ